jgi:hypothetical protein
MNYLGRELQIVSFNVPYPPDYGGVIDVFYKIKSLKSLGIKVHLHCFSYGREQSEELESICASVNYYERKKFYQAIYSSVPYIIGSRKSGELLSNLAADDYPILFEGLHTCLYLSHPSIKNKLKAVRMHNVEWDYYKKLGNAERNYLFKFYYNVESLRLKKFEEQLQHADVIFPISHNDYSYLADTYKNIFYIPAFHPNEQLTCITGSGSYILYHGNLSVPENIQAAMFILKKIVPHIDYPFIIAGKDPNKMIITEAKKLKNVSLVMNPTDANLYELIKNAHINLLLTFQSTGIKLKLLNALHRGRFCMVNKPMIEQTGLEEMCIIENDANSQIEAIKKQMGIPFTEQDLNSRMQLLSNKFSNHENALNMARAIWKEK